MQEQPTSEPTPEHRRKVAVAGHPGVYKKGSRYLVAFRHKGRQQARSFRTLSEAVRFKGRIVAGDTQPTSRQPFKRYAPGWLKSYAGRTSGGVGSKTRDSYEDAINRFAIPYFGTTRLDEIDAPMLRAFIATLAAKELAASTVRRYYAPVRALLATAYEDGLIRTNPAANVRVIVPRTPGKRKRLSPEETRKLLFEMPADHADLAYLLAATGLRIGEALAATWNDIGQSSDGRPVLTVPRSKTPSGERVIPLSPETLRRLTRRRARAIFQSAASPVFPNRFGKPIDPHNYRRRVFAPAAERAGVGWATPHALRHGLATLMAENGSTPAQIAAQLGHADGGVLALRTYIHAEITEAPGFIDDSFAEAQ
jgi:integrase